MQRSPKTCVPFFLYSGSATCPAHYVEAGNRCFRFFDSTEKHEKAIDACDKENLGARLAELRTVSRFQYTTDLFNTTKAGDSKELKEG